MGDAQRVEKGCLGSAGEFRVACCLLWIRTCLLLNSTTQNPEERCMVLVIE